MKRSKFLIFWGWLLAFFGFAIIIASALGEKYFDKSVNLTNKQKYIQCMSGCRFNCDACRRFLILNLNKIQDKDKKNKK